MEKNSFEFTEGFIEKLNTSGLRNNIYNLIIRDNNLIASIIENLCDTIDGQNDKMSEVLKYGVKSTLVLTNEQFSAMKLQVHSLYGTSLSDEGFNEIKKIIEKQKFVEKIKILREKYFVSNILMGKYFILISELILKDFEIKQLINELIFHANSLDIELSLYINKQIQEDEKNILDIIMDILEAEYSTKLNK